ncbi:MAG TPA: acyltransferase [Gemmatirosa sp.]
MPSAGLVTPAPVLRWLRQFFAVPTDAHAIRTLVGVRALAASLVFLVHYQAAFGYLLRDRTALYRLGQYAAELGFHGVTVFFVLSGFLIYGSLLARPVRVGRYLHRRARRIYPTFLVVLGVYLVLSLLVPDRSKLPAHDGTIRYIVANALLLPGVFPVRPIMTVSWSLSFEVCFYVLVLAVVAGLRLRDWRPAPRVLLWTALTAAWVVSGANAQGLVRSFILFVPGILLVEATRSDGVRAAVARVPLWLTGVTFALALVAQPLIAAHVLTPPVHIPFVGPGVVSFFLLATAIPLFLLRLIVAPEMATVLSREPVRRLGVVSYSFYLTHGLTINALAAVCAVRPIARFTDPLGAGAYVLLFPGVFAAATLVAFAVFRVVEEPLSLRVP